MKRISLRNSRPTLQKEKIRLDELLVRRNFAPDLKRAASLILSGSVLISDSPVTKPGFRFKEDADIRIREKIKNHSSRGYLKLKPVMEKFGISVRGRVCIDIGASTGGFTEILLEGNAERVYALDVGYGQLAEKLRKDSRVTVMDRFHIRELNWTHIQGNKDHFFVVIDLSFISVLKAFEVLFRLKKEKSSSEFYVLALVKPQFETDPENLKNGILYNDVKRIFTLISVIRRIRKDAEYLGAERAGIKGTSGNQEYFVYFKI